MSLLKIAGEKLPPSQRLIFARKEAFQLRNIAQIHVPADAESSAQIHVYISVDGETFHKYMYLLTVKHCTVHVFVDCKTQHKFV